MQKANASYQLMQFIGLASFGPGSRVQSPSPLHDDFGMRLSRSVRSSEMLTGSLLFHCTDQPVPEMCACLPAPSEGGPLYALTNWRKRPTVTSYLSSPKPVTVAVWPSGKLQLLQPS